VTLLSLLAGAALLIASLALLRVRRMARRLERLTEAYWELRYEQGQLRGRMARLDPDAAGVPADLARQTGATAFVPLSSLKK